MVCNVCYKPFFLWALPLHHNFKIMATIKLTTADFKRDIFNYETEKDWKYTGKLPALIDFYADWCGPCKMVAPVLEELAAEYEGKIIIYKVDTEVEQELSAVFGIQSIPSFLFIPMEGTPMMQPGALPKNVFKQAIENTLLAAVK
jgi:thioredoxin 1